MSLIVEQTLPYTSQELKLDDPTRWSRLFPLVRPSIKSIESLNGQTVVIDTALSKSQDVLLAAVGTIGTFSSKILSESHLAAFTVEKAGTSGVSVEDFSKILKDDGFSVQNGLVVLRSGSKAGEVRSDENVLEVSVEGELEFDHVLSLLAAAKPEVKASFERTRSLLEHFLKSSTKTTSTFHANKTRNRPSVIHRNNIAEFNSAKKAIDKDLNHLLSTNSSKEDSLVYSIHFSDINGLSRLENNILAHEITQYFEDRNLPLYLTHSTIQSPTAPSRGWSISLSQIPPTYLSPLPKPAAPLSNSTTTSTTTTKPASSSSRTTTITLPSPSTIQTIISHGCNKLITSEPKITHYDTLVGDGDCGTTLSSGASFVLSFLSSRPVDSFSAENISITISNLVEELEINMGGTSGALYCIFLSSLSTQLLSTSNKTFAQVLKSALTDLMRYTKARKGDRTMMDALIPFIETLVEDETSVENDSSKDNAKERSGINKALDEAKKGVESTKTMEANLGRSSYLDESATRGVPDPGAFGLLKLFEGMVEGMNGGITSHLKQIRGNHRISL